MVDLFGHDPEPRRAAPDYSADFAAFWQQYPKKVARADAERAYTKARKSTDAATIFAGLMRYAQHVQGIDPKFILHGASWLNGKRWEDELTPPKTTARDWLAQEIANGFDQGTGGEGQRDSHHDGTGLAAYRGNRPYH